MPMDRGAYPSNIALHQTPSASLARRSWPLVSAAVSRTKNGERGVN